ncbi:hypothetical protein P9281_08755 [Caballeronia sp. LP003]|uniref:hypothetical protein n=1 Tax=Caballeronia sp. LP003 TaxID=3038551 RepID=UPI00285DC662|nr:hypothetical protein [Caballeronia sp. LP003]MDR5786632.1 hypothetical protein [Caballeronia sp. LP003]
MAERIRATKSTGAKISRVPVFVTRLWRRKIQIRRMGETKASAENVMIFSGGCYRFAGNRRGGSFPLCGDSFSLGYRYGVAFRMPRSHKALQFFAPAGC